MVIGMNIFIILLCALSNQVLSETQDVFPAKILAQHKTISEKSDLYLTCSTFGIKKNSTGSMYLLRNSFGSMKLTLKQTQDDITFQIAKVGQQHSGNYSCVYSTRDYEPSELVSRGLNIIEIMVIDNFLPANISMVGPSIVQEGGHVEFSCTIANILHTLGECQLIQSYLQKNETILSMQAFNVTLKETKFTIEEAVQRDSGHYSCFVLPSKCIQGHEHLLDGRKTVSLQVTIIWIPTIGRAFGVVILIVSLGICQWFLLTKRGHPGTRIQQSSLTHQENGDMSEQQEQIEEESQEGEEVVEEESFNQDSDEFFDDVISLDRADSGHFYHPYHIAH